MRLKLPDSEQLLFAANILAGKLLFRSKPGEDVSSILVVKWDEIGDMAACTHVFGLLKTEYPGATLHVLCKPFVAGMITCDPHVDGILTDVHEWNRRYDVVAELRGTWKTLFKSLRFRPRFRCSRALVRWQRKGRQLHETETNFEAIRPLLKPEAQFIAPKLYYSDADQQVIETYLTAEKISRIALIHAGARRKLRQWNRERFALAASYLHKQYGMDIIFIGSEDEQPDIKRIMKDLAFKSHDASGLFTLSQLACLCSRADFYLGNESGPLQIACTFQLPLIALFGPGVPEVFYPRHKRAVVLHHIMPCNPCDQIHCVQPSDPCISRIQTADVLIRIDEILRP